MRIEITQNNRVSIPCYILIDTKTYFYGDAKIDIGADITVISENKLNNKIIHPFFDGNGRTGRVLMNLLLLTNGYPYVVISLDNRSEYFQSLEDDTFTNFMIDRINESFNFIEKYHS